MRRPACAKGSPPSNGTARLPLTLLQVGKAPLLDMPHPTLHSLPYRHHEEERRVELTAEQRAALAELIDADEDRPTLNEQLSLDARLIISEVVICVHAFLPPSQTPGPTTHSGHPSDTNTAAVASSSELDSSCVANPASVASAPTTASPAAASMASSNSASDTFPTPSPSPSSAGRLVTLHGSIENVGFSFGCRPTSYAVDLFWQTIRVHLKEANRPNVPLIEPEDRASHVSSRRLPLPVGVDSSAAFAQAGFLDRLPTLCQRADAAHELSSWQFAFRWEWEERPEEEALLPGEIISSSLDISWRSSEQLSILCNHCGSLLALRLLARLIGADGTGPTAAQPIELTVSPPTVGSGSESTGMAQATDPDESRQPTGQAARQAAGQAAGQVARQTAGQVAGRRSSRAVINRALATLRDLSVRRRVC